MATLRDTLRAATAAEHAALERTGVLRAFSCADTTPAVYAEYLARQWRVHRLIEPVLHTWIDEGWAAARLVKSKWLRQDLATLQCCAEPREVAWNPPCSRAQAMGTMYVLEGATLGIRQSVRALPSGHPAHGPANRFVQGYGLHTGARWKDLLARLEEVDAVHWPDVVIGAADAFRAFETHFSDGSHAEFDQSTAR
jgi:heme oxygenase